MAQYTMSLQEILMTTLQGDETLLNPDVMLKAAKATLFDHAPVNLIDDKYRDLFITGFTAHFLDDEIGFETLPRWKIALTEKLLNHSAYINQIYDALDKQVFADYRITQTDAKKEHNIAVIGETTSKQDTVSNGEETAKEKAGEETTRTTDMTIAGTSSIDRTNTSHTDDTEDTTKSSSTDTTSTDKHTGTDTVAHEGTTKYTDTKDDTNTRTDNLTESTTSHEEGSETKNSDTTTSEKRDETKVDSTTETNKAITDPNGETYTSKSSSENGGPKLTLELQDTRTDTSANSKDKQVTKESNTPQNGLESIENGTYLTAAQIVEAQHSEDPLDENGKSSTNATHNYAATPTQLPHSLDNLQPSDAPNGTWTVDGSKNQRYDYTPGKDTDVNGTLNVTGSGTENVDETNSNTKDGTNTVTNTGTVKDVSEGTLVHDETVSSKDVTTKDLTDTSTENVSGTETGKLTKDSTTTDTGSETGTDTKKETGTVSDTGNRTSESGRTSSNNETVNGSSTNSTTTNGNENTDVATTTYSYAHEILIRSESLTPRIWRLFEDIFMLVY